MTEIPRPFLVLACVLVLAASGCIPDPPDLSSSSDRLARHIGKRAPEPQHRVDALLGGKVVLLGYDIDPSEPRPGKTTVVTWHWHCLEPLEGDWQLFTHLVDAKTGRMVAGGNFDSTTVADLRSTYPPGRWQAGDYVADEQRIVLPEKIPFEEAELRVGIYRGTERLSVDRGPSDGESKIRGHRFETGYAPPPVPELVVPRAEGAIVVDGRLTEADWARAARTGPYVSATDGEPGRPRTVARLLYDAEHLYLAFECEDDHIHSTFTRRDDELWRQDAVEVFIDPPGLGRDYLEIQVSPTGLIFDTRVHLHPRRDDSWDSAASAAAVRDGTLNDDSDVDRGWTAELAIPLRTLSSTGPAAGDRWRLNLFRLDDRLGGRRAFLAWSAPLSNTTHVPERFGTIVFGPATGSQPGDAGPGERRDGARAGGEAGSAEGGPGAAERGRVAR